MHDLIFTPQAFNEYLEWLAEDKKIFKKINDLIKVIQHNGLATGIGKPEPRGERELMNVLLIDDHPLINAGRRCQQL